VRRVRRADFFAIENSCRQPFKAGIMHGVSTQDAVQISGATSHTYLIEVAERAFPGYPDLGGATLQLPAQSSARPNTDALLHHYARSAAEFPVE
jgi:hypothetical protein